MTVEITKEEVVDLIATKWLNANSERLFSEISTKASTAMAADADMATWLRDARNTAKMEVQTKLTAWIDDNVRQAIESELEKYMDVRAEALLKNVYKPSEAEMQKLFQRCVSRIVSHALGQRVNEIAHTVTDNILVRINEAKLSVAEESA